MFLLRSNFANATGRRDAAVLITEEQLSFQSNDQHNNLINHIHAVEMTNGGEL
jgi:hypothetical protein